MNMDALKREMMKMWKDVFHDTDEYINIVFDNYFNPEYICYREKNGKLIAMMLGVPYEFWCGKKNRIAEGCCDNFSGDKAELEDARSNSCIREVDKSGDDKNKNIIRGLYLCGLATSEEYRGQGIMTEMLDEVNQKAYSDGFDFTFLIPASDGLREYYKCRNYNTMSWRLRLNFTKSHTFKINNSNDDKYCNQTYINCNPCDGLDVVKIDMHYIEKYGADLIDWIYNFYENGVVSSCGDCGFEIRHSKRDLYAIVKENLESGGGLYVVYKSSSDCKSIIDNSIIYGFALYSMSENGIVEIPHIYSTNKIAHTILLNSIKSSFENCELSLFVYSESCDDIVVKSSIFEGDSIAESGAIRWGRDELSLRASQAIPYAMGRILNPCEILKFACNCADDSKYSILVKSDFNAKSWKICCDKNLFSCKFSVEEIINPARRKPEMDKRRKTENQDEEQNQEVKVAFRNPKDSDSTSMTLQDLASIIWRPRTLEDYAALAFGIPRIPFHLCYMLD